jgi:transposase
VLFSDHEDGSISEIIAADRSQWLVESDFRQMKDRDLMGVSPMFHFTEQTMRVHVAYGVLALSSPGSWCARRSTPGCT